MARACGARVLMEGNTAISFTVLFEATARVVERAGALSQGLDDSLTGGMIVRIYFLFFQAACHLTCVYICEWW